ncbi:helix-hairpin-helix domain-containing protein [Chlorobium sp. KB01]|uniref:ComEA family DNA-binding protein n=1 Tax=Chlorobium sp. KB01 TaxID=1917528 RepID=UPI000978C40B|nr:helix-hairpin-helix domain-containing protein [Chlorobium sp. KB01]
MKHLENLARKLSLTKAEISLISMLLGFLVLGGILKNFRSMEETDQLVKKAESARLREAEVDSLLRFAAIDQTTVREDVLQEVTDAEREESSEKPASHRSAGKKTFSGTIAFNKAGKAELQKISGIGPVMAGRLIAFRASKGGKVTQFQDFLDVKGIGKKKLEVLKKHFTLE